MKDEERLSAAAFSIALETLNTLHARWRGSLCGNSAEVDGLDLNAMRVAIDALASLRAPKGELEEARAEAERLRERLHVIIDAWKSHAGGDLSDEEFSGSIAEAAYQEDRAALSRARGEGT